MKKQKQYKITAKYDIFAGDFRYSKKTETISFWAYSLDEAYQSFKQHNKVYAIIGISEVEEEK